MGLSAIRSVVRNCLASIGVKGHHEAVGGPVGVHHLHEARVEDEGLLAVAPDQVAAVAGVVAASARLFAGL